MSETEGRRRDLLLLIVAVTVFGVNWPVMKIALNDFPPLWMVGLRFLTAAAALWIFTVAIGRPVRLPAPGDWPVVLSVGLLQMAGMLALATFALRIVPPGRAAVLLYTTPLWVVLLEWLVLHQKPAGLRFVAVIIGLAGLMLLVLPSFVAAAGSAAVLGIVMLLVGAMMWAGCMLHVRHHNWVGGALSVAPWQMLVAGVPTTIAALALEGGPQPEWLELRPVLLMAFIGPITSGLGFYGIVDVGRRLNPGTLSSATTLVPIVGLATSAALIGERLDAPTIAGIVLILAGIWLTGRRRPATVKP